MFEWKVYSWLHIKLPLKEEASLIKLWIFVKIPSSGTQGRNYRQKITPGLPRMSKTLIYKHGIVSGPRAKSLILDLQYSNFDRWSLWIPELLSSIRHWFRFQSKNLYPWDQNGQNVIPSPSPPPKKITLIPDHIYNSLLNPAIMFQGRINDVQTPSFSLFLMLQKKVY